MALEPGDTATNGRLIGRHSGSAQYEDDETRRTVACFEILFFSSARLWKEPEKARRRSVLGSQQFLTPLFCPAVIRPSMQSEARTIACSANRGRVVLEY
jgi:hypothetical protein